MDEERMRKKLEDLRKKKEFRRKDFWGPTGGINEIRILPNWTGDLDADFYYQTAYHKNLGPGKDKSCVCLKAEGKDFCPVCDLQEKLYKTKEKEDAAFAREIRAAVRIYWNIVDLKEKEKGVQVMMTGVDVLDQVLAYCVNPKYGDVTNPMKGRNIVVVFTEGSKSKTGFNEYDVQPDPDRTPIEDPIWLDQMSDLKAFVKLLEVEEIEALLWGKEKSEKIEERNTVSEKEPVPEKEEQKTGPDKPCIGKFDKDDSECTSCVQINKCIEKRKARLLLGKPGTELVTDEKKEIPAPSGKSTQIEAMLAKIKAEAEKKKSEKSV